MGACLGVLLSSLPAGPSRLGAAVGLPLNGSAALGQEPSAGGPSGASPSASSSAGRPRACGPGGLERLLLFSDGGAYFGAVGADGRPSGFGVELLADGLCYEGEWLAGLRHGSGRETGALGAVFSGGFERGVRHGVGLAGPRPQGLPMYRELWEAGRLVSREVALAAPSAEEEGRQGEDGTSHSAEREALPETRAQTSGAASSSSPSSAAAVSIDAVSGLRSAATAALCCSGPMAEWRPGEVATWLRENGLRQFERAFLEAGVDGERLVALDHAELESQLRVLRYGHRCRILDALRRSRAPGCSLYESPGWSPSSASKGDLAAKVGLGVELLIPADQLQFAALPRAPDALGGGGGGAGGGGIGGGLGGGSGGGGAGAGGGSAVGVGAEPSTSWAEEQGPSPGTFRCLYLGKEVAVRLLRGGLPGSPLGQRRWQEAMGELAALRHPSLALFLGVASCGGSYYAVTESHASEGCTLRSWLEHQCLPVGAGLTGAVLPVAMAAVLHVARGVAVAMKYLHSRSVFHLRLCPSSVLLDGDWLAVKVTDYTISKLEACLDSGESHRLRGVSPWTPPEVLRCVSYPPSGPTDVYAFGAIAWELLASCRPYDGMSPAQLVVAVGFGQLRLPPPASPPPALWGLARGCLRRDAAMRPSFDEVLVALKRLLACYSAREDALGAFFAH